MDMIAPVARIDVISDAICPWCYIGKRQLESALKLLEQEQLRFSVMWHPYQLNPDMPPEGVDRAT
ncbi:MAG TPA: DsbA family protein, partial [Reyranella sp.]|nr:DsbA family protein [Reyranella sp.]